MTGHEFLIRVCVSVRVPEFCTCPSRYGPCETAISAWRRGWQRGRRGAGGFTPSTQYVAAAGCWNLQGPHQTPPLLAVASRVAGLAATHGPALAEAHPDPSLRCWRTGRSCLSRPMLSTPARAWYVCQVTFPLKESAVGNRVGLPSTYQQFPGSRGLEQ